MHSLEPAIADFYSLSSIKKKALYHTREVKFALPDIQQHEGPYIRRLETSGTRQSFIVLLHPIKFLQCSFQ
jgi:hypothetical protein